MSAVHSSLSSPDWAQKVAGFQTLRGLINASSTFTDQFIINLKNLETSITRCLQELRSQVVKEATVTIAYIAQQYQYKVSHFAGKF